MLFLYISRSFPVDPELLTVSSEVTMGNKYLREISLKCSIFQTDGGYLIIDDRLLWKVCGGGVHPSPAFTHGAGTLLKAVCIREAERQRDAAPTLMWRTRGVSGCVGLAVQSVVRAERAIDGSR